MKQYSNMLEWSQMEVTGELQAGLVSAWAWQRKPEKCMRVGINPVPLYLFLSWNNERKIWFFLSHTQEKKKKEKRDNISQHIIILFTSLCLQSWFLVASIACPLPSSLSLFKPPINSDMPHLSPLHHLINSILFQSLGFLSLGNGCFRVWRVWETPRAPFLWGYWWWWWEQHVGA